LPNSLLISIYSDLMSVHLSKFLTYLSILVSVGSNLAVDDALVIVSI